MLRWITFPGHEKIFKRRNGFDPPRFRPAPLRPAKKSRNLKEQGIQSILAVPMISGGQIMGFIGLDSVREEKMWAEDTNSLLKIVGQVFANALENKKNRQALQENEERRRTIFETFPDPVTIIQAEDGRCVDVNRAFTRLTGWTTAMRSLEKTLPILIFGITLKSAKN